MVLNQNIYWFHQKGNSKEREGRLVRSEVITALFFCKAQYLVWINIYVQQFRNFVICFSFQMAVLSMVMYRVLVLQDLTPPL